MKSNYVLLLDLEGGETRRIACSGFRLEVIQNRFGEETVVCEAEGGRHGTASGTLRFEARSPYGQDSRFTVITRRGG